jgi:hypothetical protein
MVVVVVAVIAIFAYYRLKEMAEGKDMVEQWHYLLAMCCL